MTPTITKSLNGCYTRMLRVALNASWQSHTSNEELYGDLPRVGDKVEARRMRLAGHCQRHSYLPAHKPVLWDPTHGYRSRVRPKSTFFDVLKPDSNVDSRQELEALLHDGRVWRNLIKARLWPT